MDKVIRALIKRGYKFTKDNLGYYFDRGKYRFSIIKQAHFYNCYKNELKGRQFFLQSKQMNIINVEDCLRWIINNGG